MSTNKTNTLQRVSIVAHLIFLVIWGSLFMVGMIKNEDWTKEIGLLFMFLWAITSRFSFHKTGLWKFTHTKTKDLDERELAVTNKAIRFAYSVLAVLTPLVIYVFIFAHIKLTIWIPFFFLYIAHVLPAVYLGWLGEKR